MNSHKDGLPAVSQHLKRIYADNEMEREATVKQYLMVQTEGVCEKPRIKCGECNNRLLIRMPGGVAGVQSVMAAPYADLQALYGN